MTVISVSIINERESNQSINIIMSIEIFNEMANAAWKKERKWRENDEERERKKEKRERRSNVSNGNGVSMKIMS